MSAEPMPQPQASLEGGTSSSLRQRKKSRRRLSYVVNNEPNKASKKLNEAQESVFLNMYLRKMQRRTVGRFSNKNLCCEFIVVVILSALIVYLGWDHPGDGRDEQWHKADTNGLVLILCWIVFAVGVFFILGDSPYVRMARYMVIYIPLLFFLASVSFYSEVRNATSFKIFPQQYWLLALAIVAEVVVFVTFMTQYKFWPKIVKSSWVRSKAGRVQRMWNIEAIVANDAWTMSYRGHNPAGAMQCNLDYTCKYEGDIDATTGLPDGLGRWLDDAWEGEMLTGYWKQGEPIAPFSSWNVGTDDAVVAVRVAYFKATDDAFSKNKFYPTNDQNPPECGVASVECSVSGSFYKHLPHVTLIEGPYVIDSMPTQQNNPLREVLSHLIQVGEASEDASQTGKGVSSINIQATDPRGVQVLGHVYEPTGRMYSPDTKSITVDVDWGRSEGGQRGSDLRMPPSRRQSARFLQKTLFMPKAEETQWKYLTKAAAKPLMKLVDFEVDDSSEEENDEGEKVQKTVFMPKVEETQWNHLTKAAAKPLMKLVKLEVEDSIEKENDEGAKEFSDLEAQKQAPTEIGAERQNFQQTKTAGATLCVKNWIPYMYKEALIFCPGYNSSMEASLKNLGQFLAMTKLSGHVYPVVFVWPGSYSVGYPLASKISATDINQQNMLKLVCGLKEAGIKRVHFLSHSMGVQTLLGAFRDKVDENGKVIGRSDVSTCFTLDPEFDDTEGPHEGKRQQYTNQMTCKSITLLNPCFPVRAFVDRAFLSIRRVCHTVTVVGDRNDRALGFASFINGVAPKFGYEQPEVLMPTTGEYKSKWEFMERVGRSIGELYFPPEVAQQYHDSENEDAFRRLLFNKADSIDLSGKTKSKNNENQLWLDMDVIDMTGLDTNIKGMRHSGFSLNGMLLKDLQELLTFGKRAMKRSTLLFREGNQFSFAHAPAFVSQ